MKKKILFGIGVVVLIVICFGFFLLSGAGSTYYYSQIDNSKIEQADTNGGVIDLYVCPQKWRSMLIIS